MASVQDLGKCSVKVVVKRPADALVLETYEAN